MSARVGGALVRGNIPLKCVPDRVAFFAEKTKQEAHSRTACMDSCFYASSSVAVVGVCVCVCVHAEAFVE